MRHKKLPSQNKLKELFDYDPNLGTLCWKVGKFIGLDTCRRANVRGYAMVRIAGSRYMTHRIIYKWMTGIDPSDFVVDHINHNKLDNRFINLRLCTAEQNTMNCIAPKNSCKVGNRYRATMSVDNKTVHLGYFDTPEEARSASIAAKREHRKSFSAA